MKRRSKEQGARFKENFRCISDGHSATLSKCLGHCALSEGFSPLAFSTWTLSLGLFKPE